MLSLRQATLLKFIHQEKNAIFAIFKEVGEARLGNRVLRLQGALYMTPYLRRHYDNHGQNNESCGNFSQRMRWGSMAAGGCHYWHVLPLRLTRSAAH